MPLVNVEQIRLHHRIVIYAPGKSAIASNKPNTVHPSSAIVRYKANKAFFDLDISNSEPLTASKAAKPRDRNRLIHSKPPLDGARVNKIASLLND